MRNLGCIRNTSTELRIQWTWAAVHVNCAVLDMGCMRRFADTSMLAEIHNNLMLKLNLLVLRSDNFEKLSYCYSELFGINFEFHKHGKGPFHFSAKIGELVFEIYKSTSNYYESSTSMRIGFEVDDLSMFLENAENFNFTIESEPKFTQWGMRAVVKDFEGRKVELIQRQFITNG